MVFWWYEKYLQNTLFLQPFCKDWARRVAVDVVAFMAKRKTIYSYLMIESGINISIYLSGAGVSNTKLMRPDSQFIAFLRMEFYT